MNIYTDVMIDIETTSTKYNAAILTIGFVFFNVHNKNVERKEYELLLNKSDSDDLGLHTCENTMKWWSTQNEIARKRAFEDGPRISLLEGLTILKNECIKYKCKRYWCQGINFDPIVLEHAYSLLQLTPPWKFYQLRDSRTVKDMVINIPISKPLDAHSAIADCNYQIDVVHYVYSVLQQKIEVKPEIQKVEEIKRVEIKKPKLNDWVCIGCQANNFGSRLICYKCFKDKDGVQQTIQND